MTALVPFAFEDHLFRALDREGEPWFVAGDVAKILGYRDAGNMTRALDADEKGTHTVSTLGGAQDVSIISEPGLYRAILQRRVAKNLSAEVQALIARFQRWVFHDLLPTLRRTGAYAMPGAESRAAAPPEGLEDRSLREREHNLDLVARMQAMKGPEWAFALYKRLGLPVVEPEPLPPTAAKVAADRAFVADAFAVALDAFARAHAPWTGTPRALRAALNAEASPAARAAGTWPKTDQALGTALKRLTPDLKARGILVGRRHSGERFITLALADE